MSMEMPEDLPDVTHLESWEGAYLVSETLTLRTEPTCKMTSLLKVPVDVPDFMTLQDMHGLLARETGNPALKWELKCLGVGAASLGRARVGATSAAHVPL